MMATYVVDTHAIAWFIAKDVRLSTPALQILEQAEQGDAQVLVSTLVMAELTYIAQRQRVPISIKTVQSRIKQGDGFAMVPFDEDCFQKMLDLPESWDIHDRIIAATAKFYDAILISRDTMLQSSNLLAVLW